MSIAHKFNNPGGLYFVSIATVGWIDVLKEKIEILELQQCH